jgi:hypothetical protein
MPLAKLLTMRKLYPASAAVRVLHAAYSAGIPRSVGYRQLIERSERLADQADQVDKAVGVSPLVVVPTDNLDLIADHLGER